MGAYDIRKVFGKSVAPFQFDLGEVVAAVGLDAPAVSSEIDTNGLSKLAVFVDYTRDAATAVNMTSEDAFAEIPGVNDWFDHQFVNDTTPPTHDTGDAVWLRTSSISGRWVWVVDVVGNKTRLTFTGVGSSVSDVISVHAIGIAE